MKIGLYDPEKNNLKFPNLPLMKISAYHKQRGDEVEWAVPLEHYDRLYISNVFGEEYSHIDRNIIWNANEIVEGGTGNAIKIIKGKEVYKKALDIALPYEIEHIYPDYSIYPELTKNTAYGFLTRGCPNNCGFCIVSKKEGCISRRVAYLSEFWNGQKNIKLLDANTLACNERETILQELINSNASVDFTQGLDARFVNDEIADMLSKIKIKCIHFAFDLMKNESEIIKGLKIFRKHVQISDRNAIVYILTNYDTTFEEDLYRVNAVKALGFLPDIRIYMKENSPQFLRDLQRWCNNRYIYRSTDFLDYIPRKDGKTIRQIYF